MIQDVTCPACGEVFNPESEEEQAQRAYDAEMDSRLDRERDRAWEDVNLDRREP